MATSKILLKTDEYVRINIGYGQLIIESIYGDVHVVLASSKPTVKNEAFHKLTDRQRIVLDSLDTNVWVIGKNSGALAAVTENTATGYNDYSLEVSRGNVPGAQPLSAYGLLVAGGPVTNQVIWPNGIWYAPPSSGTQVAVKSSAATDIDDIVLGTGIRKVRLIYLDSNLIQKTEDISLNGLTSVLSVATDIRFIQCMFGINYGISKAADGNISATNIAATETYSYIAADELRCSSSTRMVPAGKRLLIKSIIGSSTSGTAASSTNIRIAVSKFEGIDFLPDNILIPLGNLGFQDNSFGITIDTPLTINQGEVVALVASSDKAATISGSWFGVLEDAL